MADVKSPPRATVRENILHGYANYTYNIQLWAITRSGFNKVSIGGIAVGKESDILEGGELLISDAGASASYENPRSPSFPTDFVIDNLTIESLVGNKGPQARGVDSLTIKFNIIEPYTVTLLDRLRDVAKRSQMGDFKTLIYALKIQFFGYDEFGKPKIIPATKVIPFSLLNIQFSITNKGAVYQCDGIPTQNLVMTMLDNNVPFHVEMQGQTIADLFNAKTVSSSASTARTDKTAVPNNSSTNITKGIAKALNDNELYKVDTKAQTFANKYFFEFDTELAKATIVDPKKVLDASRPFSPAKGAEGQKAAADARVGVLTLDTVNGTIRAQAGTKITDLIQSTMQVTDFMKNQVSTTGTPDKSKPFTGIKIIPKLKILSYDIKTNFFAREITYVVKPFLYYGEDHPLINQKALDSISLVKNYEYFFTGNSRDIIRVNLDYKIAFFDVRDGTKVNLTEKSNAGTGMEDTDTSSNVGSEVKNDEDFRAGAIYVNGIASGTNSGGIANDARSISLTEMNSKLFDNGVDLLSLDIDITGDPDWIQQDNILYGDNVPSDKKTLDNGTINYQDSVTCFRFTFKSPNKDYDNVTGLIDTSKSVSASFSGIYQVIAVTSKFNKGRFMQSLKNVRLRLQKDSDTKPAPAAKSGTATTPPATVNDGRTPAPSTPGLPNINQNSLDNNGKFIGITGPSETPTFGFGA